MGEDAFWNVEWLALQLAMLGTPSSSDLSATAHFLEMKSQYERCA